MSENTVVIDNKTRVRELVETSLLIALVFIATKFINVRLPISVNGGLIHLGNTMLFTAAIVFGARKGATAGAVGMGLFDIVSGWAAWAPFTFVIRGFMGLIIGKVAYMNGKNGTSIVYNAAGILLSSVWMIVGYYITEGLLYGNWLAPMTSIPGNITQIIFGTIVSIPLSAALKKTKMF